MAATPARLAAEADAEALRAELKAAEARLQTTALLGRALALKETAAAQNYGQALELSSTFFDDVRREASATTDVALRDGLRQVLSKRDVVTTALAKGEPAVVDALRDIEFQLRRALGYSAPPPR